MRVRIQLLLVLILLALAAGCSGASDSSDEDALDDVGDSADALSNGVLDTEEAAFLTLINNYRVSKGLARLHVSVALAHASRAHSVDMATHGCFQHDSCNGTNVFTRIKTYYPYNTYLAENVAMYGAAWTAQGVFDAWKASPEHNANMLGTNYTVIGIGRATSSSGAEYWTTDFGGFTDAVLSTGFGTIASNGSFESSSITTGVIWSSVRTLNRWHTYAASGGSVTRATGVASAGTYGLVMKNPDPGVASATEVLRGAPGVNYQIAAKARWVAGSAEVVYLDFLDASYTRLTVTTVSAGTSTTYAPVTVSAIAPPKTAYVRVLLYGSGAAGNKGTTDFDDVRVTAW